ncbi:MAG TPA: hypothetical protein VL282_03235 [Tepidisphaeraceae bacterium]|jgi:hypothetical protein|nr:hypothetical protein [Tepidisphaeraceae bacterium]
MNIERMISTDMSASIVADLLKRRWTVKRIAQAIDAPIEFVKGVQEKKHVLTLSDIESLAKKSGQIAPLMILHSIKSVPNKLKPLFASTKQLLESSAQLHASLKKPKSTSRRSRTRAA